MCPFAWRRVRGVILAARHDEAAQTAHFERPDVRRGLDTRYRRRAVEEDSRALATEEGGRVLVDGRALVAQRRRLGTGRRRKSAERRDRRTRRTTISARVGGWPSTFCGSRRRSSLRASSVGNDPPLSVARGGDRLLSHWPPDPIVLTYTYATQFSWDSEPVQLGRLLN